MEYKLVLNFTSRYHLPSDVQSQEDTQFLARKLADMAEDLIHEINHNNKYVGLHLTVTSTEAMAVVAYNLGKDS